MFALFLFAGGPFIDFVTTNAEVRAYAREFLVFAALTPLLGAAAFAFDGIYTGATWTAAMRNLMMIAFALFAIVLFLMRDAGNTGLWIALLVFLGTRGSGQGFLYPRLTRATFRSILERPCGDRCSVPAGRGCKRGIVAFELLHQSALDIADKSRTFVDHRGIELDQARTRADFRPRGLG